MAETPEGPGRSILEVVAPTPVPARSVSEEMGVYRKLKLLTGCVQVLNVLLIVGGVLAALLGFVNQQPMIAAVGFGSFIVGGFGHLAANVFLALGILVRNSERQAKQP